MGGRRAVGITVLLLAIAVLPIAGRLVRAYGWNAAFVTVTGWTVAIEAACGAWLVASRPSPVRRLRASAQGVAVAAAVLSFGLFSVDAYQYEQRNSNVWWQASERIREYLLTETPRGALEREVIAWLESRGKPATTINRNHIEPGSEYPPTETGGEAWIQTSLDRHGFPFRTYVEAFYIFDATGRLVDIGIRTTTDAF